MKKFIIERNMPGAGNLTPEELQVISEASCDAIARLGKPFIGYNHTLQTTESTACI